ncbi:zinc-binding dehydrogenase [Streptomyces sp. NPDC058818]|uniref:zinc-binding dehydrogenase n=1 Tax=Streptomyces sp. NPDC058818 TaxID=3346640 RepID=UPI00369478AD
MVVRSDGLRSSGLLACTASGRLTACVHAALPLAQAADAHRAVAKGRVRGRYVLTP